MKKTLKSLPAVLFAALALTFLACSDDKDDDDEGGGGVYGGGHIADEYLGEYSGTNDVTLEADIIRIKTSGSDRTYDKVETKGGGSPAGCKWDYVYSNGGKIGAVYCADYCWVLLGPNYELMGIPINRYANLEQSCGVTINASDIKADAYEVEAMKR